MLFGWLKHLRAQPRRLKHLCAITIRAHAVPLLQDRVNQLTLPQCLKVSSILAIREGRHIVGLIVTLSDLVHFTGLPPSESGRWRRLRNSDVQLLRLRRRVDRQPHLEREDLESRLSPMCRRAVDPTAATAPRPCPSNPVLFRNL